MHNVPEDLVIKAIAATGNRLADLGETETIRVVVCGAVAGILGGDLAGSRQTLDCDVIITEPSERFAVVAEAAAHVADSFDLKPDWLNQDAGMYAHRLPAGWRGRLRRIDQFGPLEVVVVGRRDLLALKLMGIAQRPQDMEDIEAMEPTPQEIRFLEDYLDQQEAESLDREMFTTQRSVLKEWRSSG